MNAKPIASAVLPLALAACMTTSGGGASGAAPALAGTSWRFTSIDGAAPVATTTSLQFAERLNANAGCNGMSGPWRLEGNRLIAGPLVATRMFCEGKMAQEAAVGALLSGSPVVSLQGDTLTLTAGNHSGVLTRS